MARSYENVVAFALEHPWACTRDMLTVVANVLARHLAGHEATTDEIAAAIATRAARGSDTSRRQGGTVIIPVQGLICPRATALTQSSGACTFEEMTAVTNAAAADPAVSTIAYDVDSPGGNVAGATEFSRAVLAARSRKRVVAFANHMLCSAAYWPMACATEIVASPSALVGSIGVFAIHDDISEALAKLGVKRSVISAGKYKSEGADGGALSDDARAHIQQLINAAYGRFTKDVATGRGVSVAAVKEGFGQGRALDAATAQSAGLIDRIAATLDEVLASPTPTAVRAAVNPHREELTRASLAMRQSELAALASRLRVH